MTSGDVVRTLLVAALAGYCLTTQVAAVWLTVTVPATRRILAPVYACAVVIVIAVDAPRIAHHIFG